MGDDQWIAIACDGDEQWRALAGAAGRPDWLEREDFASAAARRASRHATRRGDRRLGRATRTSAH